MAMSMNQMQATMAQMHAQNYTNDMRLAQHFKDVSNVFSAMAQGEYQMYQMHAGQMPGMGPMSGMGQMPGMGSMQGMGQMPGSMSPSS
jgi:hypothetical protein